MVLPYSTYKIHAMERDRLYISPVATIYIYMWILFQSCWNSVSLPHADSNGVPTEGLADWICKGAPKLEIYLRFFGLYSLIGHSLSNTMFPAQQWHQLREYTIQFGRCLSDLYPDMVATACGAPALPSCAAPPPAQQSFESLPSDGFDLGYAKLDDVFNYLRRNRKLVIPSEWQHIIPKPRWWQPMYIEISNGFAFKSPKYFMS